jgi:hypothetical protein
MPPRSRRCDGPRAESSGSSGASPLPALPFTSHLGSARHCRLGYVFVEPGLARDDLRASPAGGHAFLCPPAALASHRARRSDRDHNRYPLYDPADQATFVVGKVGAAAFSARGRKPENLKWRDRFRQVEDSGCYWDHFAQISDAGPCFRSGPHAEDQRTRLLRASARTPRRRFGRARVAVGGARHGRAARQPWVGVLTWPANCPNSGQAMIPTRMGPGHLPTSKSLDLRAAITPENAASVSWSTEMRDALSSIVSPRSLPTHRYRAESPHPESVHRPPTGVQRAVLRILKSDSRRRGLLGDPAFFSRRYVNQSILRKLSIFIMTFRISAEVLTCCRQPSISMDSVLTKD